MESIEIWKDVADYEGKYAISNTGKIKSLEFHRNTGRGGYVNKEKVLALYISNTGYNKICLLLNKKRKYPFIHRLVAEAFIPNIKNLPCVNHIDGNKLNNCVENLEWVTYSENSEHMYRVLGYENSKSMLGTLGKLNKNSKPIIQLDLNGNFVKEWEGIRDLARKWEDGVLYRNLLTQCCKGKKKSYLGYIWKYKNSDDLLNTGHKEPVFQYSKDMEILEYFDSIPEAAVKTNTGVRNIRNSVKTGQKAGGYYWKLKNI